ncbi:alkaline phosphatase [Trypanosoma theileri]|uniref:Alkaline phosphatase n=1 Tax=Trypanosoma theileri TaxID=67003 RepID=A0A1X0P7Z9_9TRYP|nr:alkaline phosphatase [Trypanosoma theileri]ORC92699.1 alkaline phosphatase [Trypanosoma theileri]
MTMARLFVFSVLLLFILGVITGRTSETNQEIAQIVFISCNKHDREQSYWDLIASTVEHRNQMKTRITSPGHTLGSCTAITPVDALVWLGDAVYADNYSLVGGSFPNSNLEVMRSKFVQQRNAPEYTAFRRTCVRRRDPSQLKYSDEEENSILGVWDDHDMGKNDGGAEYEGKDDVQEIFLDFLGLSSEDPRRKQQGVYSFEAIPFQSLEVQAGETDNSDDADHDNKKNHQDDTVDGKPSIKYLALEQLKRLYDAAVCVVLLDVRYFRDPANATRSGDMLGEPQWRWLEERLRDDIAGVNPQTGRERCALTVIGSGVQIIMDEKVSESWGAFPKSRDRLLMLLRKYHTERVLFVSGDVHLGEIGMDSTKSAMHTLGYPIIEATSSGLTHSSAKFIGLPTLINVIFPSPRRVGIYVERNFGVLQLTVNSEFKDTWSKGTNEMERHRLEEYINVSISIHSIPKHGQSVLDLTFPLSALTHRSGCHFFNANVDKFGRVVKSKAGMSQRCSVISEESYYDKDSIIPQHYPSTKPTPFLTFTIQLIQRCVFPTYTLLQVVSETIKISVIVGIVLIITLTIYCCYRSTSNKSKVA